MRTTLLSLSVSALIALLGVSVAKAQQQPNQQEPSSTQDQSSAPIPAYHSPLASAASDDNVQSQPLNPDTHPLTGAQSLSLGFPERRSYWQPSVNVTATADSNALGPGGGWTAYSSVTGQIDLHKIAGHSDLTLSYIGGGTLSAANNIGNSVVQELSATENLTWRRYTLSFLDTLSYLPEAPLGYSGLGGLSLPGGATGGLQPGLTPLDSILTTRGERINNSTLSEFDVKLTPRSSLTFMGGYSFLHFFDNNLLNYSDATFQGGYNHELGRKDTIGILYRFNAYRYSGANQSINDHVVQLTYGRRLTGRLALQVAGGPEYALFATPVTTGGSASSESTRLQWSFSSSLTYQIERAILALSYAHGISGGSGVLAGSISDTVTGSLSRHLTRTISTAISGGYARNQALAIPGFGISSQSYNYWFGGATLSRPFGRNWNLFGSYQLQYQTSNVAFCVGPQCNSTFVRHLLSVGVSWRARPMLF